MIIVFIKAILLLTSAGKQTSLVDFNSTALRTGFVKVLAFRKHSTGEGRGEKGS